MTTTYEITYSNNTAEHKRSQMSEWQQDATPWTLTIRNGRRVDRFEYWTGPAITEDPTPAEIMECLISDAFAGAQTFEEFCADFGYDTDSRSAEATWNACIKTTAALRRLFGSLDAAEDAANDAPNGQEDGTDDNE